MLRFPVARPDLRGNESAYLKNAIETEWVSSKGPYVELFENAFAQFVGTKHAVACSSGTAALQLALVAAGIKAGDEVIVPEFTMIATAWAVSYIGAVPVFVDCGDDLNIDVGLIEDAITPKTKAVIPVHIYGRPAKMERIMEIARAHNLVVVEDACEAHGASINGKKVGSWGQMGCFSLFGNKIITSGEGGVITTDDDELADKLRYYRAMAFEPTHTFLHREVGYNFRMTNLQAAVALAQVERLPDFLEKRKQIQGWYDEHLERFTLPRPEGSVLWMYDLMHKKRDSLMEYLERFGIESRFFFKPMSWQPMYLNREKALSVENASMTGFYLPAYTSLTHDDVKLICQTVLNFIQN